MNIKELKAKFEQVRAERDYAIGIERDVDKFESLSEELDKLSHQLYKAELKEYISSL